MQTLSEIKTLDRVEPYLKDAFANKRKVMGFGHAVYKTEDPRATHLRKLSRKLGEEKGDRGWFALSEKIEEFVKREKGLYANVDFYSASLYHVLGLPTDLFTPVFAVSRVAGWTAHALEQIANNKLIRPESEYIGLSRRAVRADRIAADEPEACHERGHHRSRAGAVDHRPVPAALPEARWSRATGARPRRPPRTGTWCGTASATRSCRGSAPFTPW